VERALKSDEVAIKNVVLADTFGRGRFNRHPIPFDLKSAGVFCIDDDNDGLDFGVIFLEPYYVRLLARNEVVALEEKNLAHQADVTFDGYAMLGLPEEFTSPVVSPAGNGAVLPTMFAVQRVAVPLPDSRSTTYQRFVGAIDPELGLMSLKGMSGGPIFGFNLDGEFARYWVVAMQSAWNRSQNLVYGCPLPLLATLMTQWSGDVLSA
jgi:hypothetical protein